MGRDWKTLAALMLEWQLKNFPRVVDNLHWPLCGVGEEAGELLHALLKSEQGIRGTPEEWEAKKRDAVADIVIFTLSACGVHGWDTDDVFELIEKDPPKRPWGERQFIWEIFKAAGLVARCASDVTDAFHYEESELKAFRSHAFSIKAALRIVIDACRRYCDFKGWNFKSLVETTWDNTVSKRNWAADPVSGGQPTEKLA